MSGEGEGNGERPTRVTLVPHPMDGHERLLDEEPEVDSAPETVEDPEPVAEPEPVVEPEPADLFAAAREALERAREVRGAPPEPPRPAPSRSDDPLDSARAALVKASEARGVEPEPEVVPSRDPLAGARAALDRAKEARTRPSDPQKGMARALAEAELRRLKRQLDGLRGDEDE
ncbi:MAG: hypothetical protein KC656_06140 [Myxococcales bacterium]|nr:hypothetical protein [Myxococcales bacterium]